VGQAATYFTTFTYDAIDRVVQETHPDRNASGGQATSSISYNGRTTVTTNARGQKETKEKDPMGRLARVTDNQGNQIAYQYDAFDNLLKTVDPLGNTSSLRYDLRGRKIGMNDPDMGAWTYTYDALGQLISQTDAKGQTSTQQYDLLGRLTSKQQATQKNYWVYDQYADGTACTKGIGKLCETYSDNGYRNKVSYDSLGRPVSTTTTVDTTYTSSTTFDAQGRVDTQTWPTGIATKNTYNTLGALTSINLASNGQRLWQPLAYNERGQMTRFKYGNGVETTTTYAADTGKIQAIQAGTGNAVQNQQYQFDEVGNLTQRIDSNTGVTETYSYDSLNRLQTQSLIAGTVTRINTWQYNALGNILSQTEVGAYLYNASGQNSTRPHATTQVLGTVGQYIDPKYSYDAAGNLQTVSSRNGNGRSHYFTSFNMPESLASTGSNPASAAFIYGTDNQRVKEILARTQNGSVKTRTVYQIHPDNAGGLYYEKEQKEDGSIEHRHYVGGSILITSVGSAPSTITATKYWHKDHLGSNVAITDAAGVVIERMAYDPFGKRRTTGGAYDQNGTLRGANTDRGFTGHEHLDDLGFIHMN
jgi:YD repeat-containing protein